KRYRVLRNQPCLPKMQAIRNYSGTPPPALHEGPPLHVRAGDTVELLRGDAHSLFWQVPYNNEAKHIKILTRDGFFHIAENRKFKSLMCKSILTPHHFFTVLSPKVLGIAIARYDFCARDMRELSLLKGDVVKIYTKMSANGWWRGEVNGRVGWFPSTYVEEDE
ncbi:hypothetical protein FD754_000519, partial [Muntiacus muntjak]